MRNLGLGDSFGNLEDLGLDLTVEKTTSLYGGSGEKTGEKNAYLYGGSYTNSASTSRHSKSTEEKHLHKNHDVTYSMSARTNYLTDAGKDIYIYIYIYIYYILRFTRGRVSIQNKDATYWLYTYTFKIDL